MGGSFDQALRAKLGEVVSERRQRVLIGRRVERGGRAMEAAHGEGIARGNIWAKRTSACITAELPRVMELEPRDAFASRQARRFREVSQLVAVDEGLQDILLDL